MGLRTNGVNLTLRALFGIISVAVHVAGRRAQTQRESEEADAQVPAAHRQEQNRLFYSVRAEEFFQCDRQCRWHYNFFDRNVVGIRASHKHPYGDEDGDECLCYSGEAVLPDLVPRYGEKQFDTRDTWSGGEDSGFDSPYACVEMQTGELRTVSVEEAKAAIQSKTALGLHCGVCSACSSRADIEVLSRTRTWITDVMTRVASKFAAPWGHKDSVRLAKHLEAVGINFSSTPRDGDTKHPSCMDCWTDNIMCDAKTCKKHCWIKFFKSANTDGTITGNLHWWDFNENCLKCDEDNCGAEFIKCAGANRRSSGITSDIQRPGRQLCTLGLYSGVDEASLPTAPKPSKHFINQAGEHLGH